MAFTRPSGPTGAKTLGDAPSALTRRLIEDGLKPARAPSISEDGPHPITDERRWLARQLLDSKLSDAEAFGIVAFHPAVSDARRAA